MKIRLVINPKMKKACRFLRYAKRGCVRGPVCGKSPIMRYPCSSKCPAIRTRRENYSSR